MATALSNTIVHLEQLKQDFCNRNAHLSEQQRVELWSQLVSAPLPSDASNTFQPSLVEQTPRYMSYSSSDMTHPMSSFGSNGGVASAHTPSSMGRSLSVSSTNDLQRCSSNASSWHSAHEEQPSDYALYSNPVSMQRQPSLQPIAETTYNDGMVEYTPSEYINNCMSSSGSSPQSQSLSQPHNPRQLHVQLTENTQWSDNSTSASTPALMTPLTPSSNSMSRQGSCNPYLFDQVSMLRVHSDSSMYPILSEDGTISFPYDESKISSSLADNPSFLTNFTASGESFFSPVTVSTASASASALASSGHDNSDLAEGMTRSSSSSSESDASSASASRLARRHREINAQAGRRKIASKANVSNGKTESASSNVQMKRIRSEDGSSKTVGVLTKTPYIRPLHPKIMCPHCNERPNGFRGTHELDRHVTRAHTPTRKGFICIDASSDKKFLANCKHCRNKKVYGAYYNAAAHLRRAHFHPRKRGRKGKHDEKRGGIGGGDDPPMDYLKQHWIRDIEVENKVAPSLEDGSDSAEHADINSFNPTYDIDTSYPSMPQQSNDAFMALVDANQFVDYSSCMNEPENLYDPTVYATNELSATSATSDINDFQFDACAGKTY
ncbi:hypothetical protein K458DRAFT_341350 [Lentithecium fluviatile CBS 122367]|uniref:DUF7896 domain-containing protein n=1 Tax=Lentithecium fluviatile CBS 122367 TaxID=1168545 RepID=A0A6G1IWL3_9PLEO|nr:hypothetical protein K458DRAFT_341350 [Lentithecium fluviatile CBS 122367]